MSGARIEAKVDGTFEIWNDTFRLAICPTERVAQHLLEGLSNRLDSRAEWCFGDAITKAREALTRMTHQPTPLDGRALSIVRTKLDEAELWFTKVTP